MKNNAPSGNHFVSPAQLCIGMHVHLDLTWVEHPFTFSSFLIKSLDQIQKIQALGLRRVRYCPIKSTSQPLALHEGSTAAAGPGIESSTAPDVTAAKREFVARLDARAARMGDCERKLQLSAQAVRRITGNVFAQPAAALTEALTLVDHLMAQMPPSSEVFLHLMADKVGDEALYHHPLNVALLSMTLGRELQLPPSELHAVGLGALFHDVGKLELPDSIVRKQDPLNRVEENLLRTHVAVGVDLSRKLKLPTQALDVMAQHHEHVDGTGYPKGLRGERMSVAAKVVSVVDRFDKLCNPINPGKAVTPHEALPLIYGQQRHQFDAKVTAMFVRCMGIYPPGTIVGLSNDSIGMVVSVNGSRPLKPTVLIHDPAVPRSRGIVVDLEEEPSVTVTKTYRPMDLDPKVLDYFGLRKRLTYFIDTPPNKATPGP